MEKVMIIFLVEQVGLVAEVQVVLQVVILLVQMVQLTQVVVVEDFTGMELVMVALEAQV